MPAFVAPYAIAFADVLADAKLDTAAIDRQFADFLGSWQASAELRTLFVNPAIPTVQKVAILDKLNSRLGMQKELRNLLAVLIRNDRIGFVADVAAAWRRIQQERSGVHPAEIVTARELTEDERKTLVGEVARLAGGKIDPSFKLDQTILGGTVVRIGSTVYDGSVKGRLERLRETLVDG
jgi:F-type H+-transporting ATPase subunit delta